MDDLPFLVIHGAWIAWALVALGAAIGFGIVALVRRIADARQVHALVDVRRREAHAAAEGQFVVRGVLRGGRASSLTGLEDRFAGEAVHDRSPSLWIDCAGERVDLEGAISVRRGSSVRSSWWKHAPGQPRGPRRLHVVRDGDEVLVLGQIARRAGTAGVEYRDAAGGWVATGPLEIVASDPAIRPSALGPVRSSMLLLVCAIATYVPLRMFGAHEVAAGTVNDDGSGRRAAAAELDWDPLTIASALPGSRGAALAELEHRFDVKIRRTDQTIRQRLAIRRLAGDCDGEAKLLLEFDRYEDALARANECGAEDTAGSALLALGRYDEAIGRTTTDRYAHVVALLATGRWSTAAEVIARDPSAKSEEAGCFANLLRFFDGDRNVTFHPSVGGCMLMEALAAPSAQRTAALAKVVATTRYQPLASLASAIAWSYGVEIDAPLPTSAPLRTHAWDLETWLATRAVAARPAADTYAWLVSWHVLRGDFAAARRAATDVDRRLAEWSVARRYREPPYLESQTLDIGVQLRSGARVIATNPYGHTDDVHYSIRDGVALRTGQMPERSDVVALRANCTLPNPEPFARAVAGDGAPLAEMLETCKVEWANAVNILAVLPNVTSDRERLRAALPRLEDHFVGTRQFPFAHVHVLAARRDLHHAIGDDAAAARLQSILDRHLAALGNRERVIALALWFHLVSRGPNP